MPPRATPPPHRRSRAATRSPAISREPPTTDLLPSHLPPSQVEKLDKFTLDFIDKTFEDVGGSITKSLDVLVHYQRVFEREVIRSALDKKFVALFYAYGEELEEITALYERERHAPPIARNLPPVAGNIQWSKLLLERAEAPMQRSVEEATNTPTASAATATTNTAAAAAAAAATATATAVTVITTTTNTPTPISPPPPPPSPSGSTRRRV